MGHWSEPKINIPHYDMPIGSRMSLINREGTVTFEKLADEGWAIVHFDGKRSTKASNSLDKRRRER